jgi:Ni/Co efflux regulator RcnB
MKLSFTTGFRMTLCALAVAGATVAQAQAQPAVQPVPQAPPAHAQPHTAPAHSMHKHTKDHKAHHANKHKHGHKDGHSKHAKGPSHDGKDNLNQYERNALNRCGIFKTEDDRRACVERVRQPQLSGSVEGGGLIREYTQTVQVPPAPQAHPHMAQPPLQPVAPQK